MELKNKKATSYKHYVCNPWPTNINIAYIALCDNHFSMTFYATQARDKNKGDWSKNKKGTGSINNGPVPFIFNAEGGNRITHVCNMFYQ